MACCGLSGDFICRRLNSAEKEGAEKENQRIYDLLFHDDGLKEPETNNKENKGGADGR